MSLTDLKDFISLKTLDINYNKFNYSIFQLVKTLPSLKILGLSGNDIHGQLLIRDINALSNLEELYLDHNYIEGFETFASFSDGRSLMKLETLRLDNNRFSSSIFNSLKEFPSVKFLSLRENNFHRSEHIQDINALSSLKELDLSYSSFEDFETSTSFSGLSLLQALKLSNNNLEGEIVQEFVHLDSLMYLHLDGNNFTGTIKDCLLNINLFYLDISDNKIDGNIPRWMGQMISLRELSLSKNHLEGLIPIELCSLEFLSILDLSENNLTGALVILDLNYNDFVGTIPEWIGSVSKLSILLLKGNRFDASSAPPEVEFTTKGNSYYYEGSILKYMSGIDLSANRLIGEIPFELGNLTEIRALNLSHNNLNGTIPETFSKLHNIESLDISHNKLIRKIPNTLLKLYSLEVFSVAYNNLTGAIP
nr:LRR receptor-like serine/threonine-protein kinase GSO1 [Ipomoea batatas]